MASLAATKDVVVMAVVTAGSCVIFDSGEFCTVFVGTEDAPKLAHQAEEIGSSDRVASFYFPQGKKRTIREVRNALPRKPILSWE